MLCRYPWRFQLSRGAIAPGDRHQPRAGGRLSPRLGDLQHARQIATIAGPSIAGLVLAFSGPAVCYMVDAFSWLIMLSSLALIRTQLPERGGWRTITLASLRAGFILSGATR